MVVLLCLCSVVSELGEVVGVAVESVRPTMFGEAHQVHIIINIIICNSNRNVYVCIWLISFMILLFLTKVVLVYLSGLTLSLTSGATYGNKKYVQHKALQIHTDGLCTIVSRLFARSMLLLEVESW